jgi:hypothetical protein
MRQIRYKLKHFFKCQGLVHYFLLQSNTKISLKKRFNRFRERYINTDVDELNVDAVDVSFIDEIDKDLVNSQDRTENLNKKFK